MNEIKLTPLDDSIKEYWPPGYEFESMFTVDNPSYTVIIRSVRLRDSIWSVNPRVLSTSDTLIKYSKAEFSPVSSEPSKHIQFASPSYYQNLETDSNSELIRDDLESSYIERRKIGPYADNQLTLTWGSNNFWMYCTSIDPGTNYNRKKQIKSLSTNYDFGTRIKSSSKFAEQLGRDFGRQISPNDDLKCDNYGLQMITSFLKKDNIAIGDHIIFVDHGPVKYSDRIEEYITSFPKEHRGAIIPFVKRKEYAEQSEYRFLVDVQFHSPNEKMFYLKISDALIDLMQPIRITGHF